MRFAIIEGDLVVNVTVGEAPPEGEHVVPAPDHVGPGWTYLDGEFVAPVPVVVVPAVVSMRQARLALLSAGKLDDVEAAMAGMPRSAQIEWEFATEVRRDSALVGQLGPGVGLNDAAIDALFAEAATL